MLLYFMEKRKILSSIIGITQSAIGIISAFVTLMLFLNLLDIQIFFNAPKELLPVFLLILSLFSLFSNVNGIFLIRELKR